MHYVTHFDDGKIWLSFQKQAREKEREKEGRGKEKGGSLLPQELSAVFSPSHESTHSATKRYYAAEARHYHKLVMYAHNCKEVTLDDQVRTYQAESLARKVVLEPRPYQRAAMDAWLGAAGRGCVVLPTGAGKTLLGCMVMEVVQRTSLVIVPTIDLVRQWQSLIEETFAIKAGVWGGGEKTLGAITVMTYDSARMVMPEYGSRFGLVIFDECHHLGAHYYRQIASATIAPYRLGLTATFERLDGEEVHIEELIGARVFEAAIGDMPSKVLAPYSVITQEVALSAAEKVRFRRYRSEYLRYLRTCGVSMQERGFWQKFLLTASRSEVGRRAIQAYRIQKAIAFNSEGKLRAIWGILWRHREERILIFTHDNGLAYRIGITYFLAVITHHTKALERKKILQAFRDGHLNCIVTSKVLNEGVDVPEASVGIVVSGSGSVREHVQRLGRILRHRQGKKAKLYELVSSGTGEHSTKQRRRQHDAYQ
ncbi:MAG: DEAD/DEAH box helicase [Proteobacteria bacterium]|nr:DEAD/DEAH box helicase [Pseudomonadota bacterium]